MTLTATLARSEKYQDGIDMLLSDGVTTGCVAFHHRARDGEFVAYHGDADGWSLVDRAVVPQRPRRRDSTAARHLAVRLDLWSPVHGWGTATGEECQRVTTIPRIFVAAEGAS